MRGKFIREDDGAMQHFIARERLPMRLRMFFAPVLFMLCAAGILTAQAPVGYITSLTANPAIIAPGSPGSTVTATVAAVSGPVSGLDGLTVMFQSAEAGNIAVPIKNGTASIVLDPVLQGRPVTVFATFPGNGQPGSSTRQTTILVRESILNSALSGTFTFFVKSDTGAGGSRGGEGVSVGTLVFDGDGKVAGELDFNGKMGTLKAAPVTGTYSIDGNAFGRIVLQTTGGTQHFDLFAGISQVNYINRITQGTLTETDTPLLAGSGVLVAQTPVNELDDLLFQLNGFADCESCPVTPSPLPVSLTGRVNSDGETGTVDQTAGPLVQAGIPITSRLSTQDSFGRFTLQVSEPNQLSQQPSNFAGYIADAAHIFIVSTDPVATAILLSGTGSAP